MSLMLISAHNQFYGSCYVLLGSHIKPAGACSCSSWSVHKAIGLNHKNLAAGREITQQEAHRKADETQTGVALFIGSEGQGLSQMSKEVCQVVSIPMPGEMESLNASNAGAILMFMLSDEWPVLAKNLDRYLGRPAPESAMLPDQDKQAD